jgi:hypothetical protein
LLHGKGGVTRCNVKMQDPIFLLNGIPWTLQKFNTKGKIYYPSYMAKLTVHCTKIIEKAISMTSCWDFVTHNFFFTGNVWAYHLVDWHPSYNHRQNPTFIPSNNLEQKVCFLHWLFEQFSSSHLAHPLLVLSEFSLSHT